jgi:hypothetical protein
MLRFRCRGFCNVLHALALLGHTLAEEPLTTACDQPNTSPICAGHESLHSNLRVERRICPWFIRLRRSARQPNRYSGVTLIERGTPHPYASACGPGSVEKTRQSLDKSAATSELYSRWIRPPPLSFSTCRPPHQERRRKHAHPTSTWLERTRESLHEDRGDWSDWTHWG